MVSYIDYGFTLLSFRCFFSRFSIILKDDKEVSESEEDWNFCKESDTGTDDEAYEEENARSLYTGIVPAHKLAAVC